MGDDRYDLDTPEQPARHANGVANACAVPSVRHKTLTVEIHYPVSTRYAQVSAWPDYVKNSLQRRTDILCKWYKDLALTHVAERLTNSLPGELPAFQCTRILTFETPSSADESSSQPESGGGNTPASQPVAASPSEFGTGTGVNVPDRASPPSGPPGEALGGGCDDPPWSAAAVFLKERTKQ